MPRVTFEFMVSSDLNLSNNASSTEIISGGIWVVASYHLVISRWRYFDVKIFALTIHCIWCDDEDGWRNLISAESSIRRTRVVISRENLRRSLRVKRVPRTEFLSHRGYCQLLQKLNVTMVMNTVLRQNPAWAKIHPAHCKVKDIFISPWISKKAIIWKQLDKLN